MRSTSPPSGRPGRGRPAPRDGSSTAGPAWSSRHFRTTSTLRELDRGVKAGLRSLPEDLAEKIARHLVAAGRLIDEDPQAASAHTQFARGLAPRLAVVREAAGVAAYYTGDYATALSELRVVRRMTGDPSYLPIMADCERGFGRPERAITLAADPT